MLEFEYLLKYYPASLHKYKEHILKEYLQYKILDIIFSSKYASKLVFLGGTCIRIAHKSLRFSEDLDFDNLGVSQKEFGILSVEIKRGMEKEGFEVEIKNVFKGAYHCYIRFPGILFSHTLSGHKESKILIQIDAESQDYTYSPDKYLINKFGIFRYIHITPLSILLAQKIAAILSRKRAKGRDFFDVVYLSGLGNPDFGYLGKRYTINNKRDLLERLKERCSALNFGVLAKDVEPFLFDPDHVNLVRMFPELLDSNDLFGS